VIAGRWAGGNHLLTVLMQAGCAFTVGMLVATSQTAADIGTITLVTLIVYGAQPAPFGRALTSGLLIVVGGLIQTALSVSLWPVHRFRPEGRAPGRLYESLAQPPHADAQASNPPPATAAILTARDALAGLRDGRSVESERYLALFSQAERMRLA